MTKCVWLGWITTGVQGCSCTEVLILEYSNYITSFPDRSHLQSAKTEGKVWEISSRAMTLGRLEGRQTGSGAQLM